MSGRFRLVMRIVGGRKAVISVPPRCFGIVKGASIPGEFFSGAMRVLGGEKSFQLAGTSFCPRVRTEFLFLESGRVLNFGLDFVKKRISS